MNSTPHFPIYLDYSATNPCDPRVVDAMIPWLREHFGNPASRSHAWGWEAEEAVEKARKDVADLIGADPREIVWTSGATESNNLALKGAAQFYKSRGKHLITVKTEHKAVLDTMRELERQGFECKFTSSEWLSVRVPPPGSDLVEGESDEELFGADRLNTTLADKFEFPDGGDLGYAIGGGGVSYGLSLIHI